VAVSCCTAVKWWKKKIAEEGIENANCHQCHDNWAFNPAAIIIIEASALRAALSASEETSITDIVVMIHCIIATVDIIVSLQVGGHLGF
jgi:hypothetical protein